MNPVLLLTAVAPLIWGTTYLITTTYLSSLPAPLLGTLRILPAGLLLLALVRSLPPRAWWGRIAVLSLLRQGLFFTLLYASALRLPGGVAATIGASSAMLVVFLAWPLLRQPPSRRNLTLAGLGLVGVALISVSGGGRLDPLGILMALGFALVNALGVTLFKRWGAPAGATPLHQVAWDLTLGGLLLLPLSAADLPRLGSLPLNGWLALGFLTLVGTAVAALLWQRGLNHLPVQQVSLLAPLSPFTALILDVLIVHRTLGPAQWLGAALVLGSVVASAWPARLRPAAQPAEKQLVS